MRGNLSHIIAAGIRNSVMINKDGRVKIAGDDGEGKSLAESWNDIISVDTYGSFIVGLKSDGKVKTAGLINNGQKAHVSEWIHVVDVAAGERFVVGLKGDGTVVSTGHNGDGQCNVYGKQWRNIIDIDAGWRFTVGLTKDSKLVFTGVTDSIRKNYRNSQEKWKDVYKIAASGGNPDELDRGKGHVVGLKRDGTVVAVGDNSKGQCNVEKWDEIIAVAAGDWYTVGVKKDGSVMITGKNESGLKYIDEDIYKWKKVRDIAAGYGQTLGVMQDGRVDAIGLNDDEKRDGTKGWHIKTY